jgi:hypothetical protein
MRRNPTQQRRSKHDPGKHLAHDPRLAHFQKHASDDAAYNKYERNLQDKH